MGHHVPELDGAAVVVLVAEGFTELITELVAALLALLKRAVVSLVVLTL